MVIGIVAEPHTTYFPSAGQKGVCAFECFVSQSYEDSIFKILNQKKFPREFKLEVLILNELMVNSFIEPCRIELL
jgi:hypothetical protein